MHETGVRQINIFQESTTFFIMNREEIRVLGPSPIALEHITDQKLLLDVIARHLAEFKIPKQLKNNPF